MKCNRNYIRLLSCLLLFVTMGEAQQVRLDGIKVFDINAQDQRNKEFQIACGYPEDFKGDLFITIAPELSFDPSPPAVAGTGFTILNTMETVVSGKKQLKVRFHYQSTVSGTRILNVDFVRFPLGSLCGPLDYKINVDLKDTLGTLLAKDSSLYTVNKRVATIQAFMGDTIVHNCRDPFFTLFGVTGITNTSGPVKITYKYNQNLFKLQGITTDTQLPTSVAYTVDLARPGEVYFTATGTFYGKGYRAYLRPITCGTELNNQSFTVQGEILETPSCPVVSSATQTYKTINTNCCADFGGTPKPYITNSFAQRCAGECEQRMYVTLHNYTSTPYTNLKYFMRLNGNDSIISISASGSTYTFADDSVNLTVSLDTGKVFSFYIDFKLKGTLPASTIANQVLKVSGPPVTVFDTEAFQMVYSTVCNPWISVNEYAVEGLSTIGSGSTYELQNGSPLNTITAYLVIKRNNPFALVDYTFDYVLNAYLKVNSSYPVEYYYGTNQNPAAVTFSPVPDHIQGATFSSDLKKITFTKLNFPNECPANKVLIVKFVLSSQTQLQVDDKRNSFVQVSPPVAFSYSTVNWKAIGQPAADYYVKPSCDSLDFTKTPSSLNATEARPFYYSYVLDNIGPVSLPDIVMVGSIPHIGDKLISNGNARGSSFTLPCPSDLSVWMQEDLNGVVTNKKLALNTDYSLVFSNEGGICKDELTNPGTGCMTPTTGNCNGSSYYFKLKLKPTIGSLKGFTKLVVRMRTSILPGTPTGLQAKGTFVATYSINRIAQESTVGTVTVGTTSSCDPKPPCIECANSFAPIPGKDYVLSAWVKEGSSAGALKYTHAGIVLFFKGASSAQDQVLPIMKATGDIIDGWQRIEQVFKVPESAVKIGIKLSSGGSDAYFDDIRIHPFDANMKSFVYDPKTLRLAAELDERNYATFYEYNEEGALVRVKKETARGVMTVKESRNATRKK